jgi:hypothetical protein
MKNLSYLLIVFTFIGCTEEPESPQTPEVQPVEKLSQDEEMKRHITTQLNINALENYTLNVFKEEINGDDSTDWIITVNLLDRAINEAIALKKEAKMAELGYVGNYNYIFYMDGSTKKITPPIVIPSSAHSKLQVDFVNITSERKKDFTVDFRVRNMGRRKFFTINNNVPHEMYQSDLFTGIGQEENSALYIELEPGTYAKEKDIVEYEGILETIEVNDPKELYNITPKITKTEKEVRRWHFSPTRKQYFIINK